MQIRQSALTQFGDSLVRFMVEAGRHDEGVKFSLDYMHSVYRDSKCLTLISPETGGQTLIRHESPLHNFEIMVTCARLISSRQDPAWYATVPAEFGIKQKEKLAHWLLGVFKVVNYLDEGSQFTEKMTALVNYGLDQGLAMVRSGTFCEFDSYQYKI